MYKFPLVTNNLWLHSPQPEASVQRSGKTKLSTAGVDVAAADVASRSQCSFQSLEHFFQRIASQRRALACYIPPNGTRRLSHALQGVCRMRIQYTVNGVAQCALDAAATARCV